MTCPSIPIEGHTSRRFSRQNNNKRSFWKIQFFSSTYLMRYSTGDEDFKAPRAEKRGRKKSSGDEEGKPPRSESRGRRKN